MLPSCSIIGIRGVKAKRPTPMAEASASMPATATHQGRWPQRREGAGVEGETEELTEGGMVRT